MEPGSSLVAQQPCPPDTRVQGVQTTYQPFFSSENDQFYCTPFHTCTVPTGAFLAQTLGKVETLVRGLGVPREPPQIRGWRAGALRRPPVMAVEVVITGNKASPEIRSKKQTQAESFAAFCVSGNVPAHTSFPPKQVHRGNRTAPASAHGIRPSCKAPNQKRKGEKKLTQRERKKTKRRAALPHPAHPRRGSG